MASPSPDHVSRLRSTAGEFLRSAAPPASLWQSLLGMLSSLSHLVPGGRLRMRSLQICLHRSWDRLDPSARLAWSPDCLRDLRWWLHGDCLSRGVSLSGVPGSGLLVRRFRRRLGSSLGRQGCFRPFGPVGGSSSRQCQGVAGGASRSPPLPVLSVRGHGGGVLRQGGRHQVSCSQHHCAGDPPLVGISSDSAGSRVHSGDPQCSRGLSLPSSSAPQLRVVAQHGRVLIFVASVAGDDRPLCHLRQSPLLHLFLALPRPSFGGDGRAPPILGQSPGVRFSAVVHSSSGVGEASGVPSDPPHPSRPLLASASVVRGPPPVALPARPDLLFQPRSRRRYPGLHRLALHAWRLSSDSPEWLVSPRR